MQMVERPFKTLNINVFLRQTVVVSCPCLVSLVSVLASLSEGGGRKLNENKMLTSKKARWEAALMFSLLYLLWWLEEGLDSRVLQGVICWLEEGLDSRVL